MSIHESYNIKLSNFLLWGGDISTKNTCFENSSVKRTDPGVQCVETCTGSKTVLPYDYFGGRVHEMNSEDRKGEVRYGYVPQPLLEWINRKLNLSQRSAIRSAALAIDCVMMRLEVESKKNAFSEASGEFPFTLIQGPPGTGTVSFAALSYYLYFHSTIYE